MQPLSRDELRICREALHVYSPLALQMGMHRLKNKIDGIAFRLLYWRQYATASSIMRQLVDLNPQ
jgi:(p)ppGpp synthase/HD superfamily hydrolase